jgi:predicted transcriptional regulator
MVKKQNRNIIVLSIHPQYGNAILQGVKKVEFRRNGVPEEIEGIVLYATTPIQGIIGLIEIADCIVSSPAQLWKMYGSVGVITRKDFNEYYKDYQIGKCYTISNIFPFTDPLNLKKWAGLSKPPQSFAYLSDKQWEELKNRFQTEQANKKDQAPS